MNEGVYPDRRYPEVNWKPSYGQEVGGDFKAFYRWDNLRQPWEEPDTELEYELFNTQRLIYSGSLIAELNIS